MLALLPGIGYYNIKSFYRAAQNSTVIAVSVTALTLAFGALSAYSIARLRSHWTLWLLQATVVAQYPYPGSRARALCPVRAANGRATHDTVSLTATARPRSMMRARETARRALEMRRHPIETWRVAEDTVRLWLEAGPPGDRISLLAGRTVYEQGEVSPYFYFVLSGKLKVSVVRPDGTEMVMEFMGKGALCGEAAAFDGLPRFSMATVLEDATLVRFNAETIATAIRNNPDLALSLLRLVSVKQRIATVRLAYSALSSAEVRIAELLRRLGEIHTHVELTHEEIASLTGTTRVTVTRALKRLSQSRVIESEAGRIRVLDPVALDAR